MFGYVSRHVCNMCMDRVVDMCVDMCVDTCVDMCIYMCVDTCVDMCILNTMPGHSIKHNPRPQF